MSEHAYPLSSSLKDALRAVTGMAFAGSPLALLDTGPGITALFALMFLVFAHDALRAAVRHRQRVRIDEQGITATGPFGRRLRWNELSRVKLAYYATRRDRENGWLQLTLIDRSRRRLDLVSPLSGFELVATQAAAAVSRSGLEIDHASRHNFRELGIAVSAPENEFAWPSP